MNFFYNVYAEASSVESLEVYLQDHSDQRIFSVGKLSFKRIA